MEMPQKFVDLENDYCSMFFPEEGDPYPDSLRALEFLREMAEILERIRCLEYSPLREKEYEVLKRFKEWK